MVTFKTFLNTVHVFLSEEDLLVHKSPVGTAGAWTLRRPSTGYGRRPQHVNALDKIVLKNAKPWIDYDAKERGDKTVAYIKGEYVKNVDAADGGRAVGYFRDEENPFRYLDDKSEYKGSEYAIFDGKSFKAF